MSKRLAILMLGILLAAGCATVPCERCDGPCERKPDQYRYKGKTWPAWVCRDCNAVWDNPEYWKYVNEQQNKK